MKKDVAEYDSRCLICQQVKAKHQELPATLHPLPNPEWKWEHIIMDFVIDIPCTRVGYDAIWVIVDRLTKSVYFLAICNNFSLDRLAKVYITK